MIHLLVDLVEKVVNQFLQSERKGWQQPVTLFISASRGLCVRRQLNLWVSHDVQIREAQIHLCFSQKVWQIST